MTDDDLIAQGRDLILRFGQATEAKMRVDELATEMLKGPISPEQWAEMEALVGEVTAHWLAIQAELAAYVAQLTTRN